MNQKVTIWKRKLAKERLRKEQEEIWNKLKQTYPTIRKLRAGWTIEEFADIEAHHGIDLEQELADILREEITKELLNK